MTEVNFQKLKGDNEWAKLGENDCYAQLPTSFSAIFNVEHFKNNGLKHCDIIFIGMTKRIVAYPTQISFNRIFGSLLCLKACPTISILQANKSIFTKQKYKLSHLKSELDFIILKPC